MKDPLLPAGDGHTELNDEDQLGLRPSYIATRGELFEAEQRNIAKAMRRRLPTLERILDDKYLRDFHRAMFEDVWAWAGSYRARETNIGLEPAEISTAVRTLVHDARAWVEYDVYEADELAIRFHHRLVAVHPFPNGNGRHGRIVADQLVRRLGKSAFTWGAGQDVDTEELRRQYRRALRVADRGEITDLITFARS
jgi:Fic-DOC domain mobile mystery protein B